MNLLTIDTLTALAGVHRRLPGIIVGLVDGQVTADEVREFADLLGEATELVRDHADDQARGIVQLQRETDVDADRALASVTALDPRS